MGQSDSDQWSELNQQNTQLKRAAISVVAAFSKKKGIHTFITGIFFPQDLSHVIQVKAVLNPKLKMWFQVRKRIIKLSAILNCINTFIPLLTPWGQFSLDNPPTGTFLEGNRKLENLKKPTRYQWGKKTIK